MLDARNRHNGLQLDLEQPLGYFGMSKQSLWFGRRKQSCWIGRVPDDPTSIPHLPAWPIRHVAIRVQSVRSYKRMAMERGEAVVCACLFRGGLTVRQYHIKGGTQSLLSPHSVALILQILCIRKDRCVGCPNERQIPLLFYCLRGAKQQHHAIATMSFCLWNSSRE